MSVALSVAVAALALVGLRVGHAAWAAAALAVVAGGMRLATGEAGALAMVAAAGLALSATALERRPWLAWAAALSGSAALAAPGHAPMAALPSALAYAAAATAALAIAAAAERPRWLALALAALPLPIAVVAPAHTALAVPLAADAGHWAARSGLAFATGVTPAWAETLWTPWWLVAWLALAWAQEDQRVRLGGAVLVVAALGAAALAQVMAALQGPVALSVPGATGQPHPAEFALDGHAGVLLAIRVAAVFALTWRPPPTVASTRWAAPAAFASAATLVLVAAIAPAWYGAGWSRDPGVLTLLALLLTVGWLVARRDSRRLDDALAATLAWLAIALVGGGARVAGVIFGS